MSYLQTRRVLFCLSIRLWRLFVNIQRWRCALQSAFTGPFVLRRNWVRYWTDCRTHILFDGLFCRDSLRNVHRRCEDSSQILMYYEDGPFVRPRGHSSLQIILSQDNCVIRYLCLKGEDTKTARDLQTLLPTANHLFILCWTDQQVSYQEVSNFWCLTGLNF